MDIDLLSKMVKELILDNDRVVLPGLGCFVAEIVPSTFSDKGYTINPPYRRLYFRARPDQGDELVKFYAVSNNIQLEIADRIIMDFVAELRSVLHTKKTVVFPGLGRLRATKENNVFFVADEDLDIYPDGFGLEPVSLKTNQETPEEVSAAVEGLKSLLDETVAQPEPQSEPQPESQPESQPEPISVPHQESVPEPEPQPVPEPEPLGQPVPEEQLEPALEPTSVEGPAPTADPSPAVEPAPTTEPTPAADLAPAVEPTPSAESIPVARPKRRIWKKIMWTFIILIIIAAVLFVAFFAVSRLSPELLDNILYSKEELEIINYKL
ncbi:MAG: hypothetical protein E7115_08990 [Bacteroidales bacterium]|nr:hypothetical protein [Bacteroidales bacterium]